MTKLKCTIIMEMMMVILLFGSCSGKSTEIEMTVCGSYAVPGMFCEDLKGNEHDCSVIETDSEGRTLFSYSAFNVITGQYETAMVVCQKYDSDSVYYYEDICYTYKDSEDHIYALKDDNDWNKALQYDKMTKRSNEVTFDLCISIDGKLNYDEVMSKCCMYFGIDESAVEELLLIDLGNEGSEMYYLSTSTQKHCLIIDKTYDIISFEVHENDVLKDRIMELKRDAMWYS